MASKKAPFGTMHNQPKVSLRRQVDPAPWDKDTKVKRSTSSSVVAPGRGALSSVHQNAPGVTVRRSEVASNNSNISSRSKLIKRRDVYCEKPTAVTVKAGTPALDLKTRGKLPGSTKNAPFGTAHNVPMPSQKVASTSRAAPWEKDDSKQFQKIAFGNLKSFGAFIRT